MTLTVKTIIKTNEFDYDQAVKEKYVLRTQKIYKKIQSRILKKLNPAFAKDLKVEFKEVSTYFHSRSFYPSGVFPKFEVSVSNPHPEVVEFFKIQFKNLYVKRTPLI